MAEKTCGGRQTEVFFHQTRRLTGNILTVSDKNYQTTYDFPLSLGIWGGGGGCGGGGGGC